MHKDEKDYLLAKAAWRGDRAGFGCLGGDDTLWESDTIRYFRETGAKSRKVS